jgi:hypothetical protein
MTMSLLNFFLYSLFLGGGITIYGGPLKSEMEKEKRRHSWPSLVSELKTRISIYCRREKIVPFMKCLCRGHPATFKYVCTVYVVVCEVCTSTMRENAYDEITTVVGKEIAEMSSLNKCTWATSTYSGILSHSVYVNLTWGPVTWGWPEAGPLYACTWGWTEVLSMDHIVQNCAAWPEVFPEFVAQ